MAPSIEELAATMADLGIVLPPPVGVDPPFYAFLLESAAPTVRKGYAWLPIGKVSRQLTNHTYWGIYCELMLGHYSPPSSEIAVFSFGNSPQAASRLAHLVIKGRKRAISVNPAVLKTLEVTLPKEGLVSVVTDGFGIPLCCIETEHVDFSKFNQVTELAARGEGEGNLSLAGWRSIHFQHFSDEAKSLELSFDEHSEVLINWFRVLKVFALPRGQS